MRDASLAGIAAIFAACTPAGAQHDSGAAPSAMRIVAPLPPAPAWRGKSEALIARAGDPWITPAETSGMTRTASYAEMRAYLDRLAQASPLIHVVTIGKTALGRDLVAVIASKDAATLDGLGRDKPVVLAQAGIHPGESDGTDAGLMLLRDIALRGKQALLDKANFVFVPIFNVDGHENASAFSRPNQRGPIEQGWRTTAQNINLNRDYIKADAPAMQAMLGLIDRLDPALTSTFTSPTGSISPMTSPSGSRTRRTANRPPPIAGSKRCSARKSAPRSRRKGISRGNWCLRSTIATPSAA